MEKTLNIATASGLIVETQAGPVRSINTMRDAAQHWMIIVPEDALYINCRALITVVDEVLQEHFEDSLAANLPLRVLPLSTQPITDFDLLIDREYKQIAD